MRARSILELARSRPPDQRRELVPDSVHVRCRHARDGKIKGRAVVRFGLDPDAAAVALDDLFASRQPDSAARILAPAVEAMEYGENFLAVLRIDPDSVVAHEESPFARDSFH